ncbi:MAG TPA: IS110 family transposase [Thermoanaerobaculia bacterium]|nr:IS110 family transposase [Thermoanaerobaculia bacterium]
MEPLIVVNPRAAGIDAGSSQHWVSVPEDCDEQAVRAFGTFTEDLNALADWLVACGINTVAIEATGVYWIPLVEVLEERGLAPKLVDSRSIGRRNKKKSDVVDCQWVRQLHGHGLLDAAFRPDAAMLPLRAFMRQRRMLIDYASDHIRHMQKALDLMNLKLHLVLSDITGVTGLRIIHAILKGEHDPNKLAAMREPSCKNSEETITKALMGNYRDEHLFALDQAVQLFEMYGKQIAACDAKIAVALAAFEKKADGATLPKKTSTRRKNQPRFDARTLIFEMTGVDLTATDELEASSVLTILSETGPDMTPWPSQAHFASWLALCPNKWVTGGKPLAKKTTRHSPQPRGTSIPPRCSDLGEGEVRPRSLLPSNQIPPRSCRSHQSHRTQACYHLLHHAQNPHSLSRPGSRLLRGTVSRKTLQHIAKNSRYPWLPPHPIAGGSLEGCRSR